MQKAFPSHGCYLCRYTYYNPTKHSTPLQAVRIANPPRFFFRAGLRNEYAPRKVDCADSSVATRRIRPIRTPLMGFIRQL
eukprot:scaffold291143_cov44-Prasinocladus_malaysianus.AAC.1